MSYDSAALARTVVLIMSPNPKHLMQVQVLVGRQYPMQANGGISEAQAGIQEKERDFFPNSGKYAYKLDQGASVLISPLRLAINRHGC